MRTPMASVGCAQLRALFKQPPPFVGEAQHKAHCGSRRVLCRADDLLKVAERLRAERLRKFKKTSQSKRGAFVNDVVLNIKT